MCTFGAYDKSWAFSLEHIRMPYWIFKGMELKGVPYIEPESFQIIALVNTEFANCREICRSVSSSIITVCGFHVDWWIAKHHVISDTLCEAKYEELDKCTKGVKFVQVLLEEFHLVEYPGLIVKGNQGTIFFAKKHQVSQHTKYIDNKFHSLSSMHLGQALLCE